MDSKETDANVPLIRFYGEETGTLIKDVAKLLSIRALKNIDVYADFCAGTDYIAECVDENIPVRILYNGVLPLNKIPEWFLALDGYIARDRKSAAQVAAEDLNRYYKAQDLDPDKYPNGKIGSNSPMRMLFFAPAVQLESLLPETEIERFYTMAKESPFALVYDPVFRDLFLNAIFEMYRYSQPDPHIEGFLSFVADQQIITQEEKEISLETVRLTENS